MQVMSTKHIELQLYQTKFLVSFLTIHSVSVKIIDGCFGYHQHLLYRTKKVHW